MPALLLPLWRQILDKPPLTSLLFLCSSGERRKEKKQKLKLSKNVRHPPTNSLQLTPNLQLVLDSRTEEGWSVLTLLTQPPPNHGKRDLQLACFFDIVFMCQGHILCLCFGPVKSGYVFVSNQVTWDFPTDHTSKSSSFLASAQARRNKIKRLARSKFINTATITVTHTPL